MKKLFNKLFEITIFTGLIVMIFYLLLTGKINLYLHPKMIKYLIFAVVVLIAVDIYWISSLGKEGHNDRRFSYGSLVFIIPLILIAMNPSQISGTVIQNKTIDLSQMENTLERSEPNTEKVEPLKLEEGAVEEDQPETIEEIVAATEKAQEIQVSEAMEELGETQTTSDIEMEEYEPLKDEASVSQETVEADEPEALEEEEVIEIEDYYNFLVDVFNEPDKYRGKTVAIEGFAFREDGFESNTILLSRMMISCCAADAYVAGTFIKYPQASELTDDTWYRVIGVVEDGVVYNPYTEKNEMYMVVNLQEYEEIEAYDSPYLYPNY